MSNLQGTLSAGHAVGGNYEILGVAGSGGMGVVYRALDRRLNRTVALKFLPGELSASPRDRERFLREARTASSLDHPNIGVIHAIEETPEGQGFIVMAYYDGQSLARRIREGPLSELDAIDVAIQMANGLAEAHSRHIIHRDIKPSNVMLTSSGAVRIVDFGLAQVTTQQTATSSGATGTINYMSPEQALEKGADHRTDIWSLGVTLAEMLTGRNPFDREGVSATLLSILNEPPKPMLGIRPELQEIVYRALAKDVAVRYQAMAELRTDLERVRPLLSASAPTADPGSVTMPYPGSGGGSRGATGKGSPKGTGTAQFRRALAQASQSALPQLRDARARSSRLLLAGYVLCGLVVLVLLLLAIAPVREGLAGVFLSSHKRTAATPAESDTAASSNPSAYDDYLAGVKYLQRFDKPGNLDLAIDVLQKSVAIDPTFAVSYAQLGDALRMKSLLANDPKWYDAAEANCRKSLQLSPDLPAAYVTLGRLYSGHQQDLSLQEFQHALKLDPHNAAAQSGLGLLYRKMGRLPEAEAAFKKALALSPERWDSYDELANFYDQSGRYPEAIELMKHALQLTPDNILELTNLAAVYSDTGDASLLPQAEALLKQANSIAPSYGAYSNLGNIYALEGRHAEAVQALEKAVSMNDQNYLVWSNLVSECLWVKRTDKANLARQKAIALLEHAATGEPGDAVAQALLADFYAGLHEKEKALTRIETTLALTPDDAQNLATVADAYENLGDHKQALAYIQKALQKGYPMQQLKSDPEAVGLVTLLGPPPKDR